MRNVTTIAAMAAMFTLSLAAPSPALADAYDDCVDVCIQNYMYQSWDPVRYEFCRSSCERKYPPGFAPRTMDARLD